MLENDTGISRSFQKRMLFGIVIFVAAFPILFLNETRTMTHYRMLGKNIVSHVSASDGLWEIEKNKILPWIFRLFGFFLMFFGLAIVLKKPSESSVIPFIGNAAETGVGIVAFLISTSLCFLTISVAWLSVRPLLSIALILVALGIAASMKFLPRHDFLKSQRSSQT